MMRRLAAAALLAAVLIPGSATAYADPGSISVEDQQGLIETEVVSPGTPGTEEVQPVSEGGSNRGPRDGCRWEQGEEWYEPDIDTTWQELILRCPDDGGIPVEVKAVRVQDGASTEATVTPAVLAAQARSQLVLPKPKPSRYPSAALPDGRPYTLVRAYTWFWTDPKTFKPLKKRTRAGSTWAEVTATPVGLVFSPGNDDQPVYCDSAGVRFQPDVHGRFDRSPAGCDYRYERSTYGYPGGMLTATYSIQWRVEWVGSGGSRGVLPTMTTSTSSEFAVAEAQSVVVQ